jgi:hypothetical protein
MECWNDGHASEALALYWNIEFALHRIEKYSDSCKKPRYMNRIAGFKHFVQAVTEFIQQLAGDIKTMSTCLLIGILNFGADIK